MGPVAFPIPKGALFLLFDFGDASSDPAKNLQCIVSGRHTRAAPYHRTRMHTKLVGPAVLCTPSISTATLAASQLDLCAAITFR